RVSPSGYTKKGLSLDEATDALLEAADLCSLYNYFCKGKYIWTNFITSAKRHKTPAERTEEINIALFKSKRVTDIQKLEIELQNYSSLLPYRWRASKFVGIDLSGYEKDTPPENFYEDFLPAQKVCLFITIHAGEEASADNIWQAVFKLHANRIGHGLSLIEHKSLMELARDTQICIELCPYSNMHTNNLTGERIKKYPLYTFLKEGLNVTINSDDCATTGKSLSDEYVKAAEFFYFSEANQLEIKKGEFERIPLTKWEILRLIKAGFDNAFINRYEKAQLLRWVEEEIYEKILQLYNYEPIYPIDKPNYYAKNFDIR
ncbi:MAG: hypothetical protein N2166_05005, partial [candidate division WOR-3 bacterium]|nr:hypothetical protein [candidate division WOR-3 bacterium]